MRSWRRPIPLMTSRSFTFKCDARDPVRRHVDLAELGPASGAAGDRKRELAACPVGESDREHRQRAVSRRDDVDVRDGLEFDSDRAIRRRGEKTTSRKSFERVSLEARHGERNVQIPDDGEARF